MQIQRIKWVLCSICQSHDCDSPVVGKNRRGRKGRGEKRGRLWSGKKKRDCVEPRAYQTSMGMYTTWGIVKMQVLIRRAGAVQSPNSEAAPMRCCDHWSRPPGWGARHWAEGLCTQQRFSTIKEAHVCRSAWACLTWNTVCESTLKTVECCTHVI